MAIKFLLMALLSAAVTSADSCCRGYKFLQFRRSGILPMYESSSSPCASAYNQEDFYDNPLYQTEPIPKYDAPIGRYYHPYMEPKAAITHKCVCSKSIASQRVVSTLPRYYKRNYCSDSVVDPPCGHYVCGQYGDCGHYGQCPQCPQYGQCGSYGMPSTLFRQAPSRVLPLTLPASCIC